MDWKVSAGRYLKRVIVSFALLGVTAPCRAQIQERRVSPRSTYQLRNGHKDSFSIRQPQHFAASPAPPREMISPFLISTIRFNVKNFGAVCDGKTDDTAAIQSAYDTAAMAMSTAGGAGVVYFPASTGYCVVSTLHLPSMGYPQGWLYSFFDEGLLVTNTIFPGDNNAFVGRTSNFEAMGNGFLWGPSAEWQKPKWPGVTSAPVVDLNGVRQVYFNGIAFADPSGMADSVVHIHDDNGRGSNNLAFDHCSVMGDFDVDSSSADTLAGFGLHIEDTSISQDLNIKNFGMVTIRGGYVYSILMANIGAPNVSDLEVDDTLSEGLNKDFLTVDTSGGTVSDITLHRVKIADPVTGAPVYMIKHINNSGINWNVNVKFDQIPFNETGNGLIDPTSAPQLFSVVCIGSNCENVVSQAKQTLYMFIGMPPKSPMILYGSQYVPNPLAVEH